MERIQQSTQAGLLRPARKLGLAIASRWPWPVAVRTKTGQRMFVDLRSAIGRALFMKGEFDPAVFDPIRAALKPGGTFLDVGANIGYYSLLALDIVGPSGQVHGFEIDRRPARCLRRTAAAYGLQNLFLHEIAIGDREGPARLSLGSESGHSRVSHNGEGVSVPMRTLDSWRAASGVQKIQAVKLDIEGGELWALKGAQRLLREERPVLVCEVFEGLEPRPGHQRDELLSLLREFNYHLAALEGVCSPTVVARPLSR